MIQDKKLCFAHLSGTVLYCNFVTNQTEKQSYGFVQLPKTFVLLGENDYQKDIFKFWYLLLFLQAH